MSGSLFAQSLDHVRRLDTARARQEAPLMTEVPQATAREEAVEVMRGERRRHDFGPMNATCECGWRAADGGARGQWVEWSEHVEARVLDALLAATQDEPCATCGGTGCVDLPSPTRREGKHVATLTVAVSGPCSDCTNGRVPGAPLVLLGPEQVGVWCPKGGGHAALAPEYDEDSEAWWEGGELRDPCGSYSRGFPLFRAPFIEAQREEA